MPFHHDAIGVRGPSRYLVPPAPSSDYRRTIRRPRCPSTPVTLQKPGMSVIVAHFGTKTGRLRDAATGEDPPSIAPSPSRATARLGCSVLHRLQRHDRHSPPGTTKPRARRPRHSAYIAARVSAADRETLPWSTSPPPYAATGLRRITGIEPPSPERELLV